MEIARSITLAAPVDRVWDLVANRFHDVGDWASMIDTSTKLPQASGGAGVCDRVCNTAQGVFKEKVTTLDHRTRTLAYIAYEGLPGFVREGGNTWKVRDIGGGRTEVSMRMKFDLNPVADLLMGWMLKRQMGRAATDVLDDLKAYLETGERSAAKRTRMAKLAA